MPQPTSSAVHVNAPLTNISIAFLQKQEDFVADRVFPPVPVQKQSDVYFEFPRGSFFRSEAKKRAGATESAGTGYEQTTSSYRCDVFALHHDIPDQRRSNSDKPLDPDRNASQLLMQQMLIKKERDWVAKYLTASQWTTDFTPGTLWSAAGSDPFKDVRTQNRVIKNLTGFKANTLVVSGDVDDILQDNAAVLTRINGGSMPGNPALVTPQLLAAGFGVERYLIADAVENTAKEGATDVLVPIATKDALLVYSAPSPSLEMPSGGYNFWWSGLLGSQGSGLTTSTFRMQELKADRVETEMAYDQKLVAADLGVFFENAIA